jgi:hypothetical protein
MIMSRTQPVRDADFIAWARNVTAKCQANQNTWGLNGTQVATLLTLMNAAETAWLANLNPETSSHQTAVTKRAAIDALREFLALYVPVLVANTAISEATLEAMGLPSRKHHFHEPIKIPDVSPGITAITGQHHDVDIYAAIPNHGHPTESVTRQEYYGLIIRYRKDGEEEWHEVVSTRLHVTLLFESEDEGKHITVTAAWINPRIQHGPWSDEIRVLIN